MNTQVEKLEGNRAKVTVTVPAADVTAAIKKEYREAAAKYNIPGFRKGKAPRPVIDNALGAGYVLGSVTDKLVNDTYPLTIDMAGISPVGKPEFDEDIDSVKDGADFEYSYQIALRPVFELSTYDMCEVYLPDEGASEEEIDEQIRLLAENYFSYVDAEEGAEAADGDRVTLSQVALLDSGREYDTLTSESFVYTLGSGMMPKSYEDELAGVKVGEEKEFTIDVPADPTAYTASAKGISSKLSIKFSVVGLKVKSVPEPDEKFATENMGFASLQELRDRVSESIVADKAEFIPQMKENQVLGQLGARITDEIPAEMCEEKETEIMQDFFRSLQNQGLTFDAYLKDKGMTADEFKQNLKEQARGISKEDLALDAWARHFELLATEEDLDAEFEKAGVEDPKKLKEEWREYGRLFEVRDGVSRQKALENAVETAIVKSFADLPAAEDQEEAAPADEGAEAAEEPAAE